MISWPRCNPKRTILPEQPLTIIEFFHNIKDVMELELAEG